MMTMRKCQTEGFYLTVVESTVSSIIDMHTQVLIGFLLLSILISSVCDLLYKTCSARSGASLYQTCFGTLCAHYSGLCISEWYAVTFGVIVLTKG